MASFLDVHLEQIAQIVERRRRRPKMTLLLDRCRLRVALCDDQPAQVRAIFAGHFLPRGLALVRAEVDFAVRFAGIQKNAPPILRHLHEIEMRPAFVIDADRGSQIDVVIARAMRAHIVPPVEERGLPMLERALQHAVLAEADVVRDLFAVVDVHDDLK